MLMYEWNKDEMKAAAAAAAAILIKSEKRIHKMRSMLRAERDSEWKKRL